MRFRYESCAGTHPIAAGRRLVILDLAREGEVPLARANEGVPFVTILSHVRIKSKSESKEVPQDRADASIKQSLEHNVLDVAHAYSACAEHGESKLHGKDEDASPEEVESLRRDCMDDESRMLAGQGQGGGGSEGSCCARLFPTVEHRAYPRRWPSRQGVARLRRLGRQVPVGYSRCLAGRSAELAGPPTNKRLTKEPTN